jgi:Tat protein translocase TatB subunit
MFDISIWEIAVICLVALFAIGPKEIPQVANKLGRWVRFIRNSFAAVTAELNQEIQADMSAQHKAKTIEEKSNE